MCVNSLPNQRRKVQILDKHVRTGYEHGEDDLLTATGQVFHPVLNVWVNAKIWQGVVTQTNVVCWFSAVVLYDERVHMNLRPLSIGRLDDHCRRMDHVPD